MHEACKKYVLAGEHVGTIVCGIVTHRGHSGMLALSHTAKHP